MFAKMKAFFARPTQAQRYMAQAREMMVLARKDKAEGYTLACKAAVQSAMSYRAAAHAARFYAAK